MQTHHLKGKSISISTTVLKEESESLSRLYYQRIDATKDKQERSALRTDLRVRVNELQAEWAEHLRLTYLANTANNVLAKAVYDRAWDAAHSEGYDAVEVEYEELADLINLALDN